MDIINKRHSEIVFITYESDPARALKMVASYIIKECGEYRYRHPDIHITMNGTDGYRVSISWVETSLSPGDWRTFHPKLWKEVNAKP